MKEDIAERLAEDRPFHGSLEIDTVERLPGWKGGRATALFVTAGSGRSFKLRVCASPAQARRTARLVRRMPQVFPRLEGRDGRYLLLERLVGHRRLDEASLPEHCRALGRMYGQVHRNGRASGRESARARGLADRVAGGLASRRARRKFGHELASLRNAAVIDEVQARRIAGLFRVGLARHGLPACCELRDFHAGNVMVDDRGDLRFVDEDGVGFAVKGLGYAKLLAHTAEPRCHQDFRDGYAEFADPSFLTPEYTRFLSLLDSVHSVESKARRGAEKSKLERSLSALRRAVEA
jgi:hypothetical protein